MSPTSALHHAQAALLAACAVTLLVLSAHAQMSPAAQRGLTFVTNRCSRCHSVDRVTSSPLAIAPPFRALHERYPVEDLAEALAEGIVVGHPSMPEFQLDPGQVRDVIVYLKILEYSLLGFASGRPMRRALSSAQSAIGIPPREP